MSIKEIYYKDFQIVVSKIEDRYIAHISDPGNILKLPANCTAFFSDLNGVMTEAENLIDAGLNGHFRRYRY